MSIGSSSSFPVERSARFWSPIRQGFDDEIVRDVVTVHTLFGIDVVHLVMTHDTQQPHVEEPGMDCPLCCLTSLLKERPRVKPLLGRSWE